MFKLHFNRFLEDVNFVILDLHFQVRFYSLSNQCFSAHRPFPPILSPSLLSMSWSWKKRDSGQSLGVSWWAGTICSWLSSEMTVCITLTDQLPQTIQENSGLQKQLASEPWWQLPCFSNIYYIVMRHETVLLYLYDKLVKS